MIGSGEHAHANAGPAVDATAESGDQRLCAAVERARNSVVALRVVGALAGGQRRASTLRARARLPVRALAAGPGVRAGREGIGHGSMAAAENEEAQKEEASQPGKPARKEDSTP